MKYSEWHPDISNVALLWRAGTAERGVRISVLGPSSLRAVTHMDVTEEQCREAGALMGAALAAASA